MGCVFAGCQGTVMATGTYSGNFVVIHRTGGNRRPGRGKLLMAGFTDIAGIQMRGALATGGNTVMATNTVVDYRCMVHGCNRYPGQFTVAGITFQRGGNMRWPFARGNNVIVTARTNADYLRVIHGAGGHRYPGIRSRQVAGFAHVSTVNMRGGFATGNNAIMATDTGAQYLVMIDGANCQR